MTTISTPYMTPAQRMLAREQCVLSFYFPGCSICPSGIFRQVEKVVRDNWHYQHVDRDEYLTPRLKTNIKLGICVSVVIYLASIKGFQ